MGNFEIGRQPCSHFVPKMDEQRENRHECPTCGGLRSYCLMCDYDHHAGGWDTCHENKAQGEEGGK
jgi:hypothetical protein